MTFRDGFAALAGFALRFLLLQVSFHPLGLIDLGQPLLERKQLSLKRSDFRFQGFDLPDGYDGAGAGDDQKKR
jgi:hypothetical protein